MLRSLCDARITIIGGHPMLVLNDTQALIVQTLLTKMFVNDSYSVAQLEEAIAWFQQITALVPLNRCGAKT